MKIGIIHASSQRDKNELLHRETLGAAGDKGHQVFNFGVFPQEAGEYSYIQMAVCAGALLAGGAVDFVVTGCSSGTGMMLALNSLPGVLCAYAPTPADAYLFGRINAGNAVSLPLGLGFGWAGELNLRFTLEQLFGQPFGTGYPEQDAERKRRDTQLLKSIKGMSHIPFSSLLSGLDRDFIRPVLLREPLFTFLRENSGDGEIRDFTAALHKER